VTFKVIGVVCRAREDCCLWYCRRRRRLHGGGIRQLSVESSDMPFSAAVAAR